MWQKLQAGDTGNRETVLECYAKVAEADKAGLLKRSGGQMAFSLPSSPETRQSPLLIGSSLATSSARPTSFLLSARRLPRAVLWPSGVVVVLL